MPHHPRCEDPGRGTPRFGYSFNLVASLILLSAPIATAADKAGTFPNVHLEVTYQPKENGSLKSEFHIVTLDCFSGKAPALFPPICIMTEVVINRCFFGSTTPTAAVFSTRDDLKVRGHDGFLHVEYPENGTGVAQLEFTYKADGNPMPRITGFRGGFVGPGVWTPDLFVAEFIPLKGDTPRSTYRQVSLDCPLQVPVIELTKD